MPYKILYLNRTAEISGAEISLLLLLQGFDRTKYFPFIAVPFAGPLCERLLAMGVNLRVEPFAYLKARNPFLFLDSIRRLVRLIKDEGISLIHANDYMANQYGVIAARLTGVKIISHVRLILGSLAIRNSFQRYAHHLIANSHAVGQGLQAAGIPKEKISVVWNGVDLKAFCPDVIRDSGEPLRQRLGIPRDAFLLGAIGRIESTKGLDVLIQAMASLAGDLPQVMTLIIGDTKIDQSDDYLNRLKGLVGELGLEKQVRFLPFQEDIVKIYEGLDVVVLPSLAEPFGRVLIEAMAMEKPVVATSVGGPLEIVEDGVTGFLVPPCNSEALSRAIRDLASSAPSRLVAMGKSGRIRAQAFFSAEQYVAGVQRVYGELFA